MLFEPQYHHPHHLQSVSILDDCRGVSGGGGETKHRLRLKEMLSGIFPQGASIYMCMYV